jgi:CheY-like chemotaxis protein
MEAGYEVVTVNNGAAALKRVAESKPDLIVLDVYMPGYGGLEVCQRIREAPETARIPILLTVGKLEPFKADDARRVRADAYIVKPFEASELLTALTKLEDKIVPQGQPYKPGRFAKAIAAVEETYSGKEFGNPETGWKDRLAIPPRAPKSASTPLEMPPARAESRVLDRNEGREVVASQESAAPTPAQDASVQEAIPAVFNPRREEEVVSTASANPPESAKAEEPVPVPMSPPVVEASFAPMQQERVDAWPQAPLSEIPETTESAAASESAVKTESEVPPYYPADPQPVAEVAFSASSMESDANQPQANEKVADDEVTAALASLVPANAEWNADELKGEAPSWTNEQVLASMAATAGVPQQYSGPRWIAEPLPVPEDESALILEQEMAKAYAAFSAFEAARASGEPGIQENEPESKMATENSPHANADADSDSETPSAGQEPSLSQAPVPVENIDQLAGDHSSQITAPEADSISAALAEPKEEAAFAAAAAAGSGKTETGSNDPGALLATESVPSTSEHIEPRREAELAAAWANWKHIRESVIGSEIATPIADAPATETPAAQVVETAAQIMNNTDAGFHEIRPKEPATTSRESAIQNSVEDEVSAIASIVDSVLADLKPRLMEEIARKMGKEHRKK